MDPILSLDMDLRFEIIKYNSADIQTRNQIQNVIRALQIQLAKLGKNVEIMILPNGDLLTRDQLSDAYAASLQSFA